MPSKVVDEFSRLSLHEQQGMEQTMALPVRPTSGVEGKGVRLYVNYLEVRSLPVGEIVQYDVVIIPDISRNLKRGIMNRLLIEQGKSAFNGKQIAYDGQHNAYSLGPLPQDNYSMEVSMPSKSGRSDSKMERRFLVKLRKVSSVNIATVNDFLEGKLSYTPYDVITSLEVIFRQPMVVESVVQGRSMYPREAKERLPISGGLEVVRGFFFSLRPGFGRLLLNVDVTATTFYSSGEVLKFICELLRVRPGDSIGKLNDQEVRMVERALKGIRIETTHRPNVYKRYKILGLTLTPANQTMFEVQGGDRTSVAEYFSSKYNLHLKEPGLNCLVVGTPQKSFYLPPEACRIPGGQRFPRRLNDAQTSDMIRISNIRPQDRFAIISKAYTTITRPDAHQFHQAFNMSFGQELVQVNGRVLKTPTIFYSRASQEADCNPVGGVWNLRGKRVDTGVEIKSWAVVDLARTRDDELDAFVHELSTTCTDAGIHFRVHTPLVVRPQHSVREAVLQAADAALKSFGIPAQFILVVLASTEAATYGEVKRTSDTELGIPTQCMQVKHLRRPNKQYCANLALKINLKCGGVNSSLGRQLGFITEKPTMVLGADVTHPGVGEGDSPSIAAMVASLDIKLSRYVANVRVQDPRQEIIVEIKEMVKEHINSFHQAAHVRPARILFFRDGVSEGQFAQVLNFELNQIKAAARELDVNYRPTITMVLVQKRHHTRFSVVNMCDADRSGNIPAGTVVDTAIVHPTQFDFYLCSHAGLQGTSRPAHYHVVYDDHHFTVDQMSSMIYNMCYTFARCTRSVSYVTPAYYAHLVAFRARFYFDPARDQSIKSFRGPLSGSYLKSMFFI